MMLVSAVSSGFQNIDHRPSMTYPSLMLRSGIATPDKTSDKSVDVNGLKPSYGYYTVLYIYTYYRYIWTCDMDISSTNRSARDNAHVLQLSFISVSI